MARETGVIPSLMNGVSQQAASLRHSSQAEEVENCLSDLAAGLRKRPKADYVGLVYQHDTPDDTVDRPKFHFFQNTYVNVTDDFVAVFYDGEVEVYKIDPATNVLTTMTVNYIDTTHEMFASQSSTLNTDDIYGSFQLHLPATAALSYTATISATATILIEHASDKAFTSPTTIATITASGTASTSNVARSDNGGWIRARITANTGTVSLTIDVPGAAYIPRGDTEATLRCLTAADYTFVANHDFVVRGAWYSTSGSTLTGTVQSFSDLPGTPSSGNVYYITGDASTNFDDYYVEYDGTTWAETVKPGIKTEFNDITMPHTLVRVGPTTFEFGADSWNDRVAGDLESAPWPKFTDNYIRDMVLYRNRLGILAGEYISLSRVGNAPGGYFSFFPETVQSVLDSDPIDIGMAHDKVTDLQWGVTFNESLLLFSTGTQFIMNPLNVLTPETAKVDPTTEFSCSKLARPHSVGNNVYFISPGATNDRVREYFVAPDSNVNDAADVTAHVPEYLPTNIRFMTASTRHDMLVCGSIDDPTRLYIYNYFWDGTEKAQSAWSKWTIPGDVVIHKADLSGDNLYIIVERLDKYYVLRVGLTSSTQDIHNIEVHLDWFNTATGGDLSYSAVTGKTTITTDHAIDSDWIDDCVVVVDPDSATNPDLGGTTLTPTYATSSTFTVDGDWSGDTLFYGLSYNQKYTFSEQFVKRAISGGKDVSSIVGRLQLLRWFVSFRNTGHFQAKVAADGRDTVTYTFNAREATTVAVGDGVLADGTYAFGVYARSSDATITLENNTWQPSVFLSAEWVGNYSRTPVIPPTVVRVTS